jgi:hypothetical protein
MSRLYKFHFDETEGFLRELSKDEVPLYMEPAKHSFLLEQNQKVVIRMRLPLFYPDGEEREPLWHYLERVNIPQEVPSWNILLMEAGRAAVGQADEGNVSSHKNIRKYMVRKKSGKAQLTHLKTKGKSRYGSRLRLQESEAYFVEIIERLQQEPECDAPFVFYHCPVRLKSFLDQAAEDCGFEMDKFKWRKLGVSVKECSFDELKRHSREPLFSRLLVEDEDALENFPLIPEYKKE